MTVALRRFLLDGIGPPGARFDPLDVDLTDDGHPVGSAVLFLENGGGKSVLLRLLFSVVLAGRRNTVGQAKFDNYVGSGDTGHVALEWATGDSALVTGTVLEWRNRTRSSSSSNLQQFWYSFAPQPGILDLDLLPTRDGDRRVTRSSFRERLTALAREHPALDLNIVDGQQRWTEHLLGATALDPETFRYQRQMNADEADAENLFEGLRTDDDFVRFIVEAIADPDDLDDFGDLVEAHAGQLSRHRELLVERDFCTAAAAALRPLAEAAVALEAAERGEREANAAVAALRARLAAAVAVAADDEREATRQADVLAAEAQRLDAAAKVASSSAAEHRRLEAQFVLTAARQAETAVEDRLGAARLTVDGWRSAGLVAQLGRESAELAQLVAAQESVVESLEPLRVKMESAAGRYAGRLHTEAAALAAAAEAADSDASEADAEAAASRRAADDAQRAEGEAVGRGGLLRRQVETVELAIAAARAEGMVAVSESVATAAAAAAAAERMTRDSLAGEREVRKEAGRRRDAAQQRLAGIAGEMAALSSRADADRRELDHSQQAADRLAARPRVQEIAPGATDLWVVGDRLRESLGAAISAADADVRRLTLLAGDLTDRLDALGVDGLLPPTADVQQVLEVLQETRIAATTGWRWLATNLDDEGRRHVLAVNPALAGGVIVSDPDTLTAARTALVEAGVELESVVLLGPSDALEQVTPAVAAPIRPALYDPAWTARTRGDLEAQLDTAHRQLDDARAGLSRDETLRGEVESVLQRCPLARRDELVVGIADAESTLAALGRSRVAVEAERVAADNDLAAASDAESTLEQQLEAEALRAATLRALAEREREAIGWADEAIEADGAAATQRAAAQAAAAAALRANERAAGARTVAAQARADAAKRVESAAALGVEPTDDPAGTSTSVLQGEFDAARRVHDAERADRDLTPQIEQLERSVAHQRNEVAALAAPVRAEAERLAGTPGAGDPAVIRERLASAIAETDRIDGERSECIAARSRAESELANRMPGDRRPRHIVLPADDEPVDADAAREGAARHQQQFLALTQQKRDADTQVTGWQERAVAHRHRATVLETALHGLPEPGGPGGPDGPLEDSVEPWTGNEAAATDAVRAVRTAFDTATRAVVEAERLHAAASSSVRAVANAAEFVSMGGIRLALADEPITSLAARAAVLADELDGMRASVESELADAERHREGIIVRLSTLAESHLRQLARLARLSRLPDGLGDWSGTSFLTIEFEQALPAELTARLGVVVDEALVDPRKRAPMLLLVAAMRAAVVRRRGDRDETFRVRMLRPNRSMTVEWAGVAELANEFSGGMKLTAAICTYISMASLRANSRSGTSGRLFGYEPGPLFLDNPLGKASADYLLELQHAVARQLGVQLVHTTGVWDVEALGSYDRVVRLRNLADLRRNVRRLRVDDSATSLLPGHGSGIDRVAFTVRRGS